MTRTPVQRLEPATAPIESTGRERHDVALLVVDDSGAIDTRFRDLGHHLRPNDILVVNDSATEPAALRGWANGSIVDVHVAGPGPDDDWIIEVRLADRSGPVLDGRVGECVIIGEVAGFRLTGPARATSDGVRLWRASWVGSTTLEGHLRSNGLPIRYSHVPDPWPLDAYRTVFERPAVGFASAEMPSAARPFTRSLLHDLERKGIEIAAVTLHSSVSSLELYEAPMPERFTVPVETARSIAAARERGGRVVAVGTTVVRALESAALEGVIEASHGWTDLVLTPERPALAVDGLITGWHPPAASHLMLLESVAGRGAIELAYETAACLGYRSHEFGDSCLLL